MPLEGDESLIKRHNSGDKRLVSSGLNTKVTRLPSNQSGSCFDSSRRREYGANELYTYDNSSTGTASCNTYKSLS